MKTPALRFAFLLLLFLIFTSPLFTGRLAGTGVSVIYLPMALLVASAYFAHRITDVLFAIGAFVGAALFWDSIQNVFLPTAIPFLVLDVLEATLIAVLLRSVGTRALGLRRPQRILRFLLVILTIPLVSSGLAALTQAVMPAGQAFERAADALRFARDWYFGNVTAYVTLLAGLLLLHRNFPNEAIRAIRAFPVQFVVAVALLMAVMLFGFEIISIAMPILAHPDRPGEPTLAMMFLTLPPLVWLSYAFRQTGAAVAIALSAIPALQLVSAGYGPIPITDEGQRALAMQVYVISSAVVAFFVAALAHQLRTREFLVRKMAGYARRRARDRAEFLGTFGHEILTPLNGIMGFSQLLKHEKFEGSKRAGELVDLIDQSAKQLQLLITSVLNLNRMRSDSYALEFEGLRPFEVVEDVTNLVRDLAQREGIEIQNNVAPGAMMYANERGLRHALSNILANSLRACSEGSVIRFGMTTKPDRTMLVVEDEGEGFDVGAYEAKTRFSRGDRRAGLGLQIVDTIMSLHDGAMLVESEPGGGTKVTLTFPHGQRKRERPAAASG